MGFWGTFGIAYGVGNFIILVAMIIICFSEMEENDYSSLLFYPKIHKHLDNINLVGKIIIYTLLTIALLPALIMYYSTVVLTLLVSTMCVLFCEVFKKR